MRGNGALAQNRGLHLLIPDVQMIDDQAFFLEAVPVPPAILLDGIDMKTDRTARLMRECRDWARIWRDA